MRSGKKFTTNDFNSSMSFVALFSALAVAAVVAVLVKRMRRWGPSISSKLVKIVYLIAMARLVNNFLSYLDFGMRAKWSHEGKKSKHSIKSSAVATTTINDNNSVRAYAHTYIHMHVKREQRRVYFMCAHFQYYYRNVTIIFD